MGSAWSAWIGCLVLSPLLLAGCGTVVERTAFRATDDLVTTTPKNLAEAGHSTVVMPPPGVRFTLELQAVRETPRKGPATQHFELVLTVTNEGRVPWAADVHGIEVVDYFGATFRPSQVLRRPPAKGTHTTTHLLRFDLPVSYRPHHNLRVTVHWALVAPGRKVRISSRFRR
jgi:hypothetical protein